LLRLNGSPMQGRSSAVHSTFTHLLLDIFKTMVWHVKVLLKCVELAEVESSRARTSDIEDLSPRTVSFSAEDRHGGYVTYQLPGLELSGHGKRKTVAGKLIVHR
jgi:hypothetical protein